LPPRATASPAAPSGATTTSLALSNVRRKDGADYYYCVATNPCGPTQTQWVYLNFCPTDYNCDRSKDILDIFAFLTGWFAADPNADYNGTGGVELPDIFDFLNDWFRLYC
jgi:hypothetical protein